MLIINHCTIVINPDTSAVLDGDAIVINNLADCKVAEDDIRGIDDGDTRASDLGTLTNTDDGLVVIREIQSALH